MLRYFAYDHLENPVKPIQLTDKSSQPSVQQAEEPTILVGVTQPNEQNIEIQ